MQWRSLRLPNAELSPIPLPQRQIFRFQYGLAGGSTRSPAISASLRLTGSMKTSAASLAHTEPTSIAASMDTASLLLREPLTCRKCIFLTSANHLVTVFASLLVFYVWLLPGLGCFGQPLHLFWKLQFESATQLCQKWSLWVLFVFLASFV